MAPHGLIPAHAGKTSRCVTSNMLAAAHPRSRGENLVHFAGDVRECGSSPLTRGKRISLSQTRCKKRLIPAHAGKTYLALSDQVQKAAHPRSRGENPVFVTVNVHASGSSPLTRGKRGVVCRGRRRCRLIPAHAGKTAGSGASAGAGSAHPRSRGENLEALDATERAWGSSPLTRGKRRGRPGG